MSAPPFMSRAAALAADLPGPPHMRLRSIAGLILAGMLGLDSCSFAASPEAVGSGDSSASPSRSSSTCEQAPEWLIAAIGEGIVVRGATLSNVYVLPATTFSSGPAELASEAFASAWWVAGKLSGVGVRPEVAVWLTNRTTEDASGDLLAVDAAAQRYSNWRRETEQPIRGPGLDEIRACVGPIPES